MAELDAQLGNGPAEDAGAPDAEEQEAPEPPKLAIQRPIPVMFTDLEDDAREKAQQDMEEELARKLKAGRKGYKFLDLSQVSSILQTSDFRAFLQVRNASLAIHTEAGGLQCRDLVFAWWRCLDQLCNASKCLGLPPLDKPPEICVSTSFHPSIHGLLQLLEIRCDGCAGV